MADFVVKEDKQQPVIGYRRPFALSMHTSMLFSVLFFGSKRTHFSFSVILSETLVYCYYWGLRVLGFEGLLCFALIVSDGK